MEYFAGYINGIELYSICLNIMLDYIFRAGDCDMIDILDCWLQFDL